jgi:hypothetical protein
MSQFLGDLLLGTDPAMRLRLGVLSAELQNPASLTYAAAARGSLASGECFCKEESGRNRSLGDSVRRRFSLVGGGDLDSGQSLGIVPGHPRGRIKGDCGNVALQGDEVVERLDLVQFGGMDQAHEEVTDPRPIQGPIEERVLPMQDRLLENPLADVMPPAGLCRAGGFRRVRSKVRLVPDTA